MEFVQRKVTYRLYPNSTQTALLDETLALHCRAYNALLEEHKRRFEAGESRFNFSSMCKTLTQWRSEVDALKNLNAQSLQVTAKRVSLAFDAFFRRLKSGDEPGYPRFKPLQRFSGWGFKTYGDGWKLHQDSAKHGKVARQRHDFYHKLTGELVSRFAFLGSEELAVKNMSRAPKAKPDPDTPGEFLPNGAAAKAGLNRGILDAAPSMLLGMLRTKAAEAASVFALANTREVKPTQRCHCCGTLVKKTLKDRVHRCMCGCECGRDENAAKTLLRWLLEGDFWSGTGQTGPQGLLSETPSIAASAV